ncbi:alpha/beta hydrolase [Rhodococcus sp. HNM0569]|uniref:alpha/beta fold hydrolase n=1 Tax=Rhodococcus sp. HNM0569 TaxID=2716340 RepID=UPI00146D0820|nr:alpha/beta hydrolase [Rhodococcus sp. HNM0569]NLU83728.1 alpha/beta hydrolase [Rhodococcus sp. HNM0569]
MSDDAPRWFTRALAADVDTGEVEVDGATVRYRAWGPVGAPGLLLVHGGAAHNRWWDHIAPYLATGRRVVAPDLTGHGDSDHRGAYSLETWADEVLAAAHAGGIAGPPTVVGHSMGGLVAYVAARTVGEQLGGVVIIDSPVFGRTPEDEAARNHRAFGPIKVYPDRDDAIAHFRFVPAQDAAVPAVFAHVAETSLQAVDGGWSWKFDPTMMARSGDDHLGEAGARCRLAYFRAEHGIIGDDALAEMRTRFGPAAIVAELPDAGHHAMIDRPLSLIAAVRTVLAAWDAADATS